MKLSEDNKSRIRSLTTNEMRYEIALGRRSRFQREKFAYLQACYKGRLSEEETKPAGEQSVARAKTGNISNDPYDFPIMLTSKSVDKTYIWHETALGKIAIGAIIAIISYCIVWIVNHYLTST